MPKSIRATCQGLTYRLMNKRNHPNHRKATLSKENTFLDVGCKNSNIPVQSMRLNHMYLTVAKISAQLSKLCW